MPSDSERLDWLERDAEHFVIARGHHRQAGEAIYMQHARFPNGYRFFKTTREAIDAAMARSQSTIPNESAPESEEASAEEIREHNLRVLLAGVKHESWCTFMAGDSCTCGAVVQDGPHDG